MSKKLINILIPIFGFLFLSAYIRSATVNVIYTDYTRLVLSYLENVFSFRPYMGLDSLTRLPINYIQRIINVVIFKYSTTFDMLLGAFFLSMLSYVFGKYILEKGYSVAIYLIVALLTFSLNKWEMLTNGSGWVHFLAIFLFIYHFYVFDKSRILKRRRYEYILRYLPVFTIIFVAGPYSVSYTAIILLAYIYDIIDNKFKKANIIKNITRIIYIFIPFCLYMFSRANSIEEYAGASSMSFSTALNTKLDVIIKLFLKSFSSMIFSEEWMTTYKLSSLFVIVLSIIVMLAYIYALYINIKYKIYKYSIFPMLLILYAICNHVLVTLSRWIFLKDTYGMSSRYSLQYFIGIVGIVLSIAYFRSMENKKKTKIIRGNTDKANFLKIIANLLLYIFIIGNIFTTYREINIARYRKENFEKIRETALNFENVDDVTLKKVFQYHDGAKTRKALQILKERKLNVFK